MRGVEAEPRADIAEEPAEVEAVEHSKPLSDGLGYCGLDGINDLPCDSH